MTPQTEGEHYNHKVDLYAMGIILSEMATHYATGMERSHAIQQMKVKRGIGGEGCVSVMFGTLESLTDFCRYRVAAQPLSPKGTPTLPRSLRPSLSMILP